MLAYVTGSIDEELRLRNEYLVTENRILRDQIKGRVRLTDPERTVLQKSASVWAEGPSKKWHKSVHLVWCDVVVSFKLQPATGRFDSPVRPTLVWRFS
jgi:hypothetical protein